MAFTLQPAVGESFIDRKEIIEEMISDLTNKNLLMGFALVGNRRMGKSSVFREACLRLSRKKNLVPIYFSLWDLVERSIEEFSRSLTFSVLEGYKRKLSFKYRLKNLVKVPVTKLFDFLRVVDVRIKVLEEVEISLSKRNQEKDYSSLIAERI